MTVEAGKWEIKKNPVSPPMHYGFEHGYKSRSVVCVKHGLCRSICLSPLPPSECGVPFSFLTLNLSPTYFLNFIAIIATLVFVPLDVNDDVDVTSFFLTIDAHFLYTRQTDRHADAPIF